jgi:phosphatidylserine/phosphatidylglycerophosphate/cardiolipin synthase-like enzyme
VLRELFATAERRVLVVGFATHQGREMFAGLAARMHQRQTSQCVCAWMSGGQQATLRGQPRSSDAFAEPFVHQEWPGPRLPQISHDPRSLVDADTRRASLHPKCVVDGAKAVIGSANLTEAAQLRNIEIEIMTTTDTTIAAAAERNIDALIEAGHLKPLPL